MDDKDFLLIKTLYEEQNITHTAKKALYFPARHQ